MISTKIEWILSAVVVGCAFLWAHFSFNPQKVMGGCGGMVPVDEINIPLLYLSRVVFYASLASFYVAPVVLFARKFRKDELGQSVNFYFGERLWYYESFLVIGLAIMGVVPDSALTPILVVLSFALLCPIFIVPLIAIGYFCQALIERRFHELRSVNVFAVMCLTMFCMSLLAFFCMGVWM